MFHKLNNFFHTLFLLIVSIYTLFAVVQSSNECGTCCIENIQMTDLIKKFDILQAEMKTEINHLKSENEEWKSQLSKQNHQILQQDKKILQLEKQISKQTKSFDPPKPADSCTKKVDNAASPRALDLLPTSCDGLRKEGHFADGVYLLLNEETNKIDAVLCQFPRANQVVQVLVGTVDVKTKNAHFYVQRESNFDTPDAVIPFELAPLNEGDAFDLASGVFTVPAPGIYHFQFCALKDFFSPFLAIFLQVNDVNVGASLTNQNNAGTFGEVSLSASLRLAAGDRVNMFNYGEGVFVDSTSHVTHFSGWLVEEDLMM